MDSTPAAQVVPGFSSEARKAFPNDIAIGPGVEPVTHQPVLGVQQEAEAPSGAAALSADAATYGQVCTPHRRQICVTLCIALGRVNVCTACSGRALPL